MVARWWTRLYRALVHELARQGDPDVWFWTGLRSTAPHLPDMGPTLHKLTTDPS